MAGGCTEMELGFLLGRVFCHQEGCVGRRGGGRVVSTWHQFPFWSPDIGWLALGRRCWQLQGCWAADGFGAETGSHFVVPTYRQ